MTAVNKSFNGSSNDKLTDLQKWSPYRNCSVWPERRSERQRRSGQERRIRCESIDFADRRKGRDRRKFERRKKALKIPIFVKLSSLCILFIFIVIATISISMLNRQKNQFIAQLTKLGESMVRVVATNAKDKLLNDEDLALFQLVDDIAQNDQILYALIVDNSNTVKAHSRIGEIGKPYSPPESFVPGKSDSGIITGRIVHDNEEALFFEMPVMYQKLKVGKVYMAISQAELNENIRKAKGFLWMLTGIITLLGILLSLVLSVYFSKPIGELSKGTRALGLGNFNHRVRINRNDEFGDLANAFNRMAEDLKLKEIIQNSFGRYVTPEIVERIIANPDNAWMKSAKVVATVLFVDMRGFAGFSEGKDPAPIVDLLNAYFTRVYDAVSKYGGHINKFVGDEVMIIFGAPVGNPLHAEDAVWAAIEIQKGIMQLNREKHVPEANIYVGIGINSGEMVAGNVGSRKRMEYTVIGDNVNIASRLTSIAKGGEILLSRNTYDFIKNKNIFLLKEKGSVSVRGRKNEVGIFKIADLNMELHHDGSKDKKY